MAAEQAPRLPPGETGTARVEGAAAQRAKRRHSQMGIWGIPSKMISARGHSTRKSVPGGMRETGGKGTLARRTPA